MTKTDRLTRLFGKQIAQGEFVPGTALPSEADLCERFDTSRNVMREVIKVLSTKKLIDAQRHRGLFVAWLLALSEGEALAAMAAGLKKPDRPRCVIVAHWDAMQGVAWDDVMVL